MHRDRQGVAGVFPGNVVHVYSEKSRVPDYLCTRTWNPYSTRQRSRRGCARSTASDHRLIRFIIYFSTLSYIPRIGPLPVSNFTGQCARSIAGYQLPTTLESLPGNVIDVAVLGVWRAIIGLYVSSYTFLHCHTFPG